MICSGSVVPSNVSKMVSLGIQSAKLWSSARALLFSLLALRILQGEMESLMISDTSTSVGMALISPIFFSIMPGNEGIYYQLTQFCKANQIVGLILVWKCDRSTSKRFWFHVRDPSFRELITLVINIKF